MNSKKNLFWLKKSQKEVNLVNDAEKIVNDFIIKNGLTYATYSLKRKEKLKKYFLVLAFFIIVFLATTIYLY